MGARRNSSGGDATTIAALFGLCLFMVAIAWPWMLGTHLAEKFGAENPSPARTITGWAFEIAWLAFLGWGALYLVTKRDRQRAAAQKLAADQAVQRQRIAEADRAKAAQEAAERQQAAAKASAEAAHRQAAQRRANQRKRWTDDIGLTGDDLERVLDVDGIVQQVTVENAHIERRVRSLENVLSDGLPVPNMATNMSAAGDTDGIAEYVRSVLALVPGPGAGGSKARIAYSGDSRQLVVEYELPSKRVVPTVKWYRYIQSRDRLSATARPVAQVKSLYGNAIAQLTLLCIAYIFGSDTKRDVDVLVLNGVVHTVDPRSGKAIRPCLITVRVTRDTFAEIDLANVEPLACLKHLSASVSRSPAELVPVRPVLEFSMVDPRFVAETDTLSGMDSRPNLMDLTPTAFESLIQNLFTSMGLEAKQTRASRDGGVDCVAYDTRPIVGGKVVIQAKRYKNTVGVSAVRDLFGTLQNEGASKGILVTTSGYGKASFEFAQNKPIELLDGGNLLFLLEEHAGIKARIEVPEDWHDPTPDSGESVE
jgi:restriction system protein